MSRFLFGKKYSEAYSVHEKLRIATFHFKVLFLCSMILIILFLSFFIYLMNPFSQIEYYLDNEDVFSMIEIEYDGLTKDQEEHFKEIFSHIKPLYLMESDKIIITKDFEKYYGKCPTCLGVNKGNGNLIVIKYLNNEKNLKTTICHELLHSSFSNDGGDSIRHELIEDLDNYRTCFYG